MVKNVILGFLLIFIYFIITLLISSINITNSVTNNNSQNLFIYISEKSLKKNFNKEILSSKKIIFENINKEILIENESFTFTGTITPNFLDKFFSKMTENISSDLSKSETLLYFYFNSEKIKTYFNNYIFNQGEYSFEKYLHDISDKNKTTKIDNENIKSKSDQEKESLKEKSQNNENIILYIKKLYYKYRSTEYFFFTSPIHFKLRVNHQDLPFSVVLRFHGFKWKITYVSLPLKEIFY
jgi:hypothetical protein